MRLKLILLSVLFLVGCAQPNVYSQYYKPSNHNPVGTPAYHAIHHTGPQVRAVRGAWDTDLSSLTAEGFQLIGQTSFTINGGRINDTLIASHAENIGADLAIYGARAIGTETDLTSTIVVGLPMQATRYQIDVVYLAKVKPVIGVQFTAVPSDITQKTGTNKGAYVVNIIKGSPAFVADILVGDVILEISGEPVKVPNDVVNIGRKYHGKSTIFKVWRNGSTIEKTVDILNYSNMPYHPMPQLSTPEAATESPINSPKQRKR